MSMTRTIRPQQQLSAFAQGLAGALAALTAPAQCLLCWMQQLLALA
jgi:hypothetical protein